MLTCYLRPLVHFCTRYFEKQRVQLHFVLENLVYQCILFQILISNAAYNLSERLDQGREQTSPSV